MLCLNLQVSEPSDTAAGKGKTHKLQQSNAVEDVCRPLVDQVKAWEGIAAAEYAVDGSMDGWDDDKKQSQSSEDKYLLVIQLLTAFSCCLFLELAFAASSPQTTALVSSKMAMTWFH